jgi:hypothetical protein
LSHLEWFNNKHWIEKLLDCEVPAVNGLVKTVWEKWSGDPDPTLKKRIEDL